MVDHERLKKLRKELRLTQRQVADSLFISRSTYSSYERGVRQPSLEIMLWLADYYNVSADYLLDRTDVPFSLSRLTQQEADIVRELPQIPDDIKSLIAHIALRR